jgi:hypothetical protein
MTNEQRISWLKIAAAAVVGLLVLDTFVIRAAARHWRDQGERITHCAPRWNAGNS